MLQWIHAELNKWEIAPIFTVTGKVSPLATKSQEPSVFRDKELPADGAQETGVEDRVVRSLERKWQAIAQYYCLGNPV